jgi:hypothetical protein
MARNYYVPIASEACFRSYAEVLLGRPARSEEELDSMKLRIRVTVLPVFYSYGFKNESSGKRVRYVRQTCPPANTNGSQVLCLPLRLLSGPGTDTSGISKGNSVKIQPFSAKKAACFCLFRNIS